MAHLQYSSILSHPRSTVFSYMKDYSHLPQLMPQGITLELTAPPIRMQKGAEYEFRLSRFGIHNIWSVKIEDYQENQLFVERQILGVFDSWIHTVRFEDHGEKNTRLSHFIEYTMPFGLLGRLADDLILRRELMRIFETGHERLKAQLPEFQRKNQSA